MSADPVYLVGDERRQARPTGYVVRCLDLERDRFTVCDIAQLERDSLAQWLDADPRRCARVLVELREFGAILNRNQLHRLISWLELEHDKCRANVLALLGHD